MTLGLNYSRRLINKVYHDTVGLSCKENMRLISREGERERKRDREEKKADMESTGAGSWPLSDLSQVIAGLASHG